MPLPPVPEIVPPSQHEQTLIIGVTNVLRDMLGAFPSVVANSCVVTVTLHRYIAGRPDERAELLADMELLVRLLEAVGDAEGDEAWQRVRQVLPKNTFNQDHPAGVTVQ